MECPEAGAVEREAESGQEPPGDLEAAAATGDSGEKVEDGVQLAVSHETWAERPDPAPVRIEEEEGEEADPTEETEETGEEAVGEGETENLAEGAAEDEVTIT